MFRNSSYKYIFCFSLLLLCLAYLVWIVKKEEAITKKLVSKVERLNFENSELSKSIIRSAQYAHLDLGPELDVEDIDGNHYTWKDIELRDKIIFRFSQTNCFECIKAQIPFLKNVANELGIDKIILLVSYESRREMKIATNSLGFEVKVFNVNSKEFSIYNNNIEELNLPYVFEIDKNGFVDMLFLPIKELPKVSELFYSTLIKRYQK